MSRRGRLGFVAACLLTFALIAALITWGSPSIGPLSKAPPTVTLAPGATRPAGLAVTDLNDVGQLRERFNDDQGSPRRPAAPTPTGRPSSRS